MNKDKKQRYSLSLFVYDVIKFTAAIPGLIWHRPKVHYITPEAKEKHRGGVLLIANHVGFLDPLYMMYAVWYRRHRFICMKEIMDSWAGWIFRRFLCIPIDRENFSMDSFREITEHLKNGELVSMFPEGHVNDGSGRMGTFKSGMVLMAMKAGVPIVPMYLKGRRHWYQRFQMVMGEAVDITKIYGERPTFRQIEEITQLLYRREEELKHYIEQEEPLCP